MYLFACIITYRPALSKAGFRILKHLAWSIMHVAFLIFSNIFIIQIKLKLITEAKVFFLEILMNNLLGNFVNFFSSPSSIDHNGYAMFDF